jgi:uncharacterized phage protein gp47/JayE
MPAILSRLDCYGIGRSYILSRSAGLDPAKVDVAGSNANIYVGSVSFPAAAVSRQLGYSIARLILDSITNDDDLDRYAWDRYQLTRKGASPGVANVIFSRVSFAAGAGTVPIGTVVATLNGIQYVTTTVAAFGATDLSSNANVRATVAGSASYAAVNTLVKIVPQPNLPIWDSTLSATNPVASSGNDDAEDLETFKNRIRGFWLAARRGVKAAIEFGAKLVAGVTSAMAIEALSAGAQPARIVTLYVADSSGNSNAQLAQAVAVSLADYRACGIYVSIVTSVPTLVSCTFAFQFASNVDTVTLTQAVLAAVEEFVNSLPVNGTLYLSDLYATLRRFASDGLIVSQGTIVSPTGDVVPGVGQTLRTTAAQLLLMPT